MSNTNEGIRPVQDAIHQGTRYTEDLAASPPGNGNAVLDRVKFVQAIDDIYGQADVDTLRSKTLRVRTVVESSERGSGGNSKTAPDAVSGRHFRKGKQ